VDDPLDDEIGKRLLHRHHPPAGAGLHVRVDLLDLRLADQVADRVVGDQDLERGHAPLAVEGRHERLGDDSLQRARDLRPDLLLLLGWEDVDHAVDRRGCTLRVEGAEDEVPGLGGRQRGRDRLEVAHLAEEDHVGVLAKRRAQRLAEARRVRPDLTLVDDAALVLVEKLDRVLDRDDVIGPLAVDLVDHRRERRRLAGAGGPGDEHEAARQLRQLAEAVGQAEILERLQLVGDDAEHRRERLALHEHVDAEAGEAGDPVREVELVVELEALLLIRRQDPVEERPDRVGIEGRQVELL